jgi:hypothetical protein
MLMQLSHENNLLFENLCLGNHRLNKKTSCKNDFMNNKPCERTAIHASMAESTYRRFTKRLHRHCHNIVTFWERSLLNGLESCTSFKFPYSYI